MPLHKPTPARERIMCYGEYGSGKSYSWVKWAEWMLRTKSSGKVHLLDMDFASARQAEAFVGFEQVVVPYMVLEWPDIGAAFAKINPVATAEDLLVIDHGDTPWQLVQDWYTEQAFGKDAADFFLDFKKAGNTGNPLADAFGTNWQVINKLYNRDFANNFLRFPGHILMSVKAEPVRRPDPRKQNAPSDSPEILEMFGRAGMKPRGQNALPFQMLTVLHMTMVRQGEWRYSTIKDLHREYSTGAPLKDFVVDYLVKVAGWKLA